MPMFLETSGETIEERNRRSQVCLFFTRKRKRPPGETRSHTSLATRTRLELATSGVTGRCSNQLNYRATQGVGIFQKNPVCQPLSLLGKGLVPAVVFAIVS
jgi:hypothetical protein